MLAKQYFENWNTQRSADSDQHNKQAIIIQVLLEKKNPWTKTCGALRITSPSRLDMVAACVFPIA